MSVEIVLLLLGGLVLLVAGGEVLVRGASNIASALGMSRLVVGLTVVSFATSAPEFAVTMQSVASGSPGLAIGNVVGSNIANILLVLGVAAAITPLAVQSRIVKLDVPVMIGMSVLVTIFAINGAIASWQGALLLVALGVYLVRAIMLGRKNPQSETQALDPAWNEDDPEWAETDPAWDKADPARVEVVSSWAEDVELPEQPEQSDEPKSHGLVMMIRNIALIVAGVALLVFGANLLVNGATQIATAAGMSDMVIGLTVVAVGTSLPELATAIIATLRGERDLAIGNAVGSNIFNLGAVLGFAALVSPGGIPIPESAAHFDFILMTAVAVLILPIMYTGRVIARWEGWLFLCYYAAYTLYVLLGANQHDALGPFSRVMMAFVVPITVVVLVTLVVSERQSRVSARSG